MTSTDVAKLLRVSMPTLSRWRSSRTGPPFINLNGIPRYRESDVYAWIKEKRS
ncbi:helix-turn-helix transcriptional regulator [Microbacterium sp. NPDC087589]|uniref:helix-turn-helix transcriptional regulator n=1 Tax=Microbacterium sp. NPDC087589 TaxID=3364191 RepID=UPI003820881B